MLVRNLVEEYYVNNVDDVQNLLRDLVQGSGLDLQGYFKKRGAIFYYASINYIFSFYIFL